MRQRMRSKKPERAGAAAESGKAEKVKPEVTAPIIGVSKMEQLDQLVERTAKSGTDGYPPYNIEQRGEDAYRITLAVAGFAEEDWNFLGGAQIPLSTFARTDPAEVGFGLGADASFVSLLIHGMDGRPIDASPRRRTPTRRRQCRSGRGGAPAAGAGA